MTMHPIIPAAPGFVALTYFEYDDGDEPIVDAVPVVAWQIDDGKATPITCTPYDRNAAVQLPDGHVIDADGDPFEDRAEWLRVRVARDRAKRVRHLATLAENGNLAALNKLRELEAMGITVKSNASAA